MELGIIRNGAEAMTHKTLELTGGIAVYGMQLGAVLGEAAFNRFGRPGRGEIGELESGERFKHPHVLSETGLARPSARALEASRLLRDSLPPGD